MLARVLKVGWLSVMCMVLAVSSPRQANAQKKGPSPQPTPPVRYQRMDLPLLPGATGGFAHDINDQGEVVGELFGMQYQGVNTTQAFHFVAGITRNLNDFAPPGIVVTNALAINNLGQIAANGHVYDPNSPISSTNFHSAAFRLTPNVAGGYTFDTLLPGGVPGDGSNTPVGDINDHGDITLLAAMADGVYPIVWPAGAATYTYIGGASAYWSRPTIANRDGNGNARVAKYFQYVIEQGLFDGTTVGTWFNIGGLTSSGESQGGSMSAAGDIVGTSKRNRYFHAFHWSSSTGTMLDLGTLGGNSSVATAIHGAGSNAHIIGLADASKESRVPFLYTKGADGVSRMWDLRALMVSGVSPPLHLNEAVAINGARWICGPSSGNYFQAATKLPYLLIPQ